MFRAKAWSPYVVGAGIGILSWFAFATADRPIGITSAFEYSAALIGQGTMEEAVQPYLAAKAAEGKRPTIDWEWMLVVGVFIGAWLSARLGNDRTSLSVPPLWQQRFGASTSRRFIAAFAGGALMMFGARLAQGCTSGHGISGALQLALSSWIFVILLFASGVVAAFALYGREASPDV